MQQKDPIVALKHLVAQHGTQALAAKSLGISQAYLSDMLNGRRACSVPILQQLGLERVVVARKSA